MQQIIHQQTVTAPPGRDTWGAGRVDRDSRLTKEQEAIRLRGLRILARMIVRAHLRSLIEQDAAGDGSGPAPTPGGGTSVKEGEHGR